MSKSIPQSKSRSRFMLIVGAAIVGFGALLLTALPERQAEAVGSNTIVISQVYGGGGNAGATLRNDFIELFNRGASPVNVTGWTVQYASAGGTTWTNNTTLSGTIQPGHYYLVQEAAGAAGTANLPTPDATGTTNMSATAGKVALVNNATPLTGSGCPLGSSVVDFIGFGTGVGAANCSETSPAPTLTNTTAGIRGGGGCNDTDINSADFSAGAPNPRNSVSPLNSCGGPTNPSGTGSANPSTVAAGGTTLLTVSVTGGANPASTGLTVNGNLSSIGGSTTQQFFDDGTHGDLAAGDKVFSFQANVSAGTSAGAKSLPATITDAQSRSGSASIALAVTAVSTPPSGTGSATPNSLQPGGSTLLKVNVTPGSGPASTGLAVTGDLSSISGSANQQFFDNGTNGDAVSGDNIFSYQATVSNGTIAGGKSLPINISDAQARTGATTISMTVLPPPPPTTIKISQAYGGGGNSGSTYTNDFIEVYNQGPTTIDVTNWSVQYQSATATGLWQVTNLCVVPQTCTVAPGHYYLVQESQGAAGTTQLPAPDAVGIIAMSGTSAKVALVNSTTALVTPTAGGCPTPGSIADLVGYGSTNCSETSPTAALSATTASIRRGNGCIDTDNNAADFVTIGPLPRNSASPVNSCGGDPTQPSGLGLASPSTLEPANSTVLTVTVTPATTPPSTALAVVGDLSPIAGSATQQFYNDGTHGDQTAGDNIFSFQATVPVNSTFGVRNIVTTITDAQSRTATAPITLTVASPTCGVERWSVKTGTDPDAGLVDLNNPVPATIAALGAITPPADPPGPPLNARLAPTETTVYVINATMTLYKKETDVDYHIVLQDDTGHTMIAEIPCPCCVGGSSPFVAAIANARAKFDARFTATSNFQTANIPVQVTGVGFFDFIHGQSGVAPNGIELHPLLDINFTANTTTTLMSNSNPSQYAQPVSITATVTNGGPVTPTGTVTFFDGTNPVDSTTLDASGKAAFNTSTLSVGSHSITAAYGGDSTSAPSTSTALVQVVNKADQFITFTVLANKTYGDTPFNVTANASSGLVPVTFQIQSGPATISGNTVTITGVGVVSVTASQAGDTNYNPAPDAQQSFTVSQANANISVNGSTTVYDGSAHGASGSATGVNGEDLTNLLDFGPSFTDVPGGTAHWSFAGNANYAPANGNAAIVISRASSTTVVTCSSGETYTGSAIEPCSATVTGAGGLNQSVLVVYTNNVNAGAATATATYGGDSNHDGSSGNGGFTIIKAPSATTVNCPTSAIYTGSAIAPCTASYSGVGGLSGSLTPTYANNTNAGAATASATFGGDGNHDGSTGNSGFTVTKASSNTSVDCPATATYTGAAIEPCTATVTGPGGLNQTAPVAYANNVNTGAASATATYGGDLNHDGSSGNGGFTITKAPSATMVNCPATATYTGSASEPCTATATGAGGLSQTVPVVYANNVNAGAATATATYGGDSNHDGSSGNGAFIITRAPSTTTVNCPASAIYTGSAIEPCTASYSGVGGLSGSLTPTYASNTSAGSATASATYSGDANHEGSTGNGGFEISRADSTTTVTCTGSPTYTGSAITPCAVAVAGPNLSLSPAPVYANNVNAGIDTASASYTFAGDANHLGSSDSKTFSIGKAAATVSVDGSTVVYDGQPHGATGTATGVNGENLTSLLDFGASFTNVPGGTAHWTFAGNANYSAASGDATITINKATPIISWGTPADIVYGTALSSIQLSATANVGGTFSYTPGAGTVLNSGAGQPLLSSFTPSDATNYNATSKTVMINVPKATPAFSNLSSPTIGCHAATTNLSGKIKFGSLVPSGNVSITFNSVTQNAAIQPDGSFSASFNTASLTPANSPYGVSFIYGGDVNFNSTTAGSNATVVDTTPPTISCPAPIIVDATSAAGAVVTYTTPAATDSCPVGPVTVNCSAPSGSTFPIGATTVTCTARDAANNTTSCPFVITVRAPRQAKQDILAALTVLRAATTSKNDQEELDDAIKHLNNALDPTLWIDNSHLYERNGERVFSEEARTVEELAELIKNKKSMNPTDQALMDLISRLVQVDRVLALISISEESDSKKVAKAMNEIARGDNDRDTEKPDHSDNAIGHYKNAWKKT